MASYIQDPVTLKLIPKSEYVSAKRRSHFIQNDIEGFQSPIDGSIITDRKQLREHNAKHNVVSAQEFTPEFYDKKAKERARIFTDGPSSSDINASVNEAIKKLERR